MFGNPSSISRVSQIVRQYAPEFSPGDYGFKSLAAFLESYPERFQIVRRKTPKGGTVIEVKSLKLAAQLAAQNRA